ncbi:hypothetical protein NEUTE2DRAFT_52075, partial [Neurospora tetrasperma FGSC 2509]
KEKKTYNTRDSLVVTDPTTSLALTGLSMGERTGSRVFQWVWSYVLGHGATVAYGWCELCSGLRKVLKRNGNETLWLLDTRKERARNQPNADRKLRKGLPGLFRKVKRTSFSCESRLWFAHSFSLVVGGCGLPGPSYTAAEIPGWTPDECCSTEEVWG